MGFFDATPLPDFDTGHEPWCDRHASVGALPEDDPRFFGDVAPFLFGLVLIGTAAWFALEPLGLKR